MWKGCNGSSPRDICVVLGRVGVTLGRSYCLVLGPACAGAPHLIGLLIEYGNIVVLYFYVGGLRRQSSTGRLEYATRH